MKPPTPNRVADAFRRTEEQTGREEEKKKEKKKQGTALQTG